MPENELSSFQPVPGHPELIQLNFREGEPLKVPLHVYVELDCRVGMQIPTSFYAQLNLEAAKAEAKERVLRSLSRRSLTVRDVMGILQKQEVLQAVRDSVIEEFLANGLLDDRKYAQMFVTAKARRLSRTEIVWKLSQRGVSKDVAQEAVREEHTQEQEFQAALRLAEKHWRRHEGEESSLRFRKLGAYLQRRGFSMEVIHLVFNKLSDKIS